MPRQKEYKEDEVLEKAMLLFWRNGYEATSVRMLEKEMGINQFSMYSSFGNKQGVFHESLKLYVKKINQIVEKLEKSSNGIESIKQYFYDFLELSREDDLRRGCLMVNTVTELGDKIDDAIMDEMLNFLTYRDSIFIEKLRSETNNDPETLRSQANYLDIAIQGLAVASKAYDKKQLEDYIESTFKNL